MDIPVIGGGGNTVATYLTKNDESATLINSLQLTGTSNQIVLSTVGSQLVVATPQNLHVGATPQFAGQTLTGNLVMSNSGRITGLLAPSAGDEPATKDYVDDALIFNVNWQDPVINATTTTPPLTPSEGDRYLVPTPDIGAVPWEGTPNNIWEFDGLDWVGIAPVEGMTCYDQTANHYWTYNGTAWVSMGSVVDHGNLTGLSDDDHSQYIHINNARTITAAHTFNVSGAPFLLGAGSTGQLVTGLNADLWDGYQFSDYLDQAVKTSSTPTFGGVKFQLVAAPTTYWKLSPNSGFLYFVYNSGSGDTIPWNITSGSIYGAASYGALITSGASALANPAISFRGNASVGLHSSVANKMDIVTNSLSRIHIDDNGNVGISTSTFGTSGTKVLALAEGVAPISNGTTNQVQLYSEDFGIDGTNVLHIYNEDGTVVKLNQSVSTTDSPTFANITDSGLTASRLLASDGSKILTSVSDLSTWIIGTANRVTVTNNGVGGVTLSGPQDLATTSTVTHASLRLDRTSSAPELRLTRYTDANTLHSIYIGSTGDLYFDTQYPIGTVVGRVSITRTGCVSLGAITPGTAAEKTLVIGNGVAPSTSVAGVQIYSLAGVPTFMSSTGGVYQINQSLLTTSNVAFNNLTVGNGAAGIDYTITLNGETNDGILTWMEDEARLDFDQNIALKVDNKKLYFGTGYDTSLYYNGTDLIIDPDEVGTGVVKIGATGNNILDAAGTYGNIGLFSTAQKLATAVTTVAGTVISGTYSDTQTINQVYYQVEEVAATPGFDVQFTFNLPIGDPAYVRIVGRYTGNAAHEVEVQIYNYTTVGWDDINATTKDLPSSSTDSAFIFNYPIDSSDYRDVSGNVLVRFYHTSAGVATHNLYIDYIGVAEKTLSMPVDGTKYQLTGMTTGESNDCTVSSSSITVTRTGKYLFVGNISFGGLADSTVKGTVYKNGVDMGVITFKRRLDSNGDVGSAGGNSILSLTANDVLTFYFSSDAVNSYLSIDSLSLSVYKLN